MFCFVPRGKMALFQVGMLFSSYEELKIKIEEYQRQNQVQLATKGSETVEAAKKKFPKRSINEALVYNDIRFACADCLKNKNWFKSIDVKFDIEMGIRLAATKDGRHLEVRKINEKHSHPLGKASKLLSTTTRKRKEDMVDAKVEPDFPDCTSPGSKTKRKSLPDCINLGKQTERWKDFKRQLNVKSDEEFADILLNHLAKDFNMVKPKGREMNSGPGLPNLAGHQLGLPVHASNPVMECFLGAVNIKEEPENDWETCSRNSQNSTSFEYGSDNIPSCTQSNSKNCREKSSDATSYSANGIIRDKNLKVESELFQSMNRSGHQLDRTNNISNSQVCLPTAVRKSEELVPQDTTAHYYPSQQYETISPHKEVRSLHEFWNKIRQEAQLSGGSSVIMLPTMNIGTQFDENI